ncbi:MAG: tetratricopeptide repeat protein [Variibacter sp.]
MRFIGRQTAGLTIFRLRRSRLTRPGLACALFAVVCLSGVPDAVAAQTIPGAVDEKAAGGKDAPRERGHDLQFLFGALKAAPDEESAKLVERRIMALWLASGSDTSDLLMARSKAAIDGEDYDLAIKLLDAILELKPDFAEAWNRRATVYFLKKDYARALDDLRQVLAREPRHFGALAGLGLILQEFGDDKRALDIFQRALDVNPHLSRIPDLVKSLREKVDGRAI